MALVTYHQVGARVQQELPEVFPVLGLLGTFREGEVAVHLVAHERHPSMSEPLPELAQSSPDTSLGHQIYLRVRVKLPYSTGKGEVTKPVMARGSQWGRWGVGTLIGLAKGGMTSGKSMRYAPSQNCLRASLGRGRTFLGLNRDERGGLSLMMITTHTVVTVQEGDPLKELVLPIVDSIDGTDD